MKFLICGIGSIGQRHYTNLRELGHEVAVCRSGKGGYNEEFIKKFFIDEEDQGRPVKVYTDISTALNIWDPTAVFICTPNFAHIDLALIAARRKKHLFIEKPLSHNLLDLNALQALCKENNLVTMVGYNLRFHSSVGVFHDYVEKGECGQPLSCHVDIVDWHPWENYAHSYGPWKQKGGGVVLCMSHDIDYLYWFFGKPKGIHAIGGKLTELVGDAEDTVKVLFDYENGLIVSLDMDYWQKPSVRTIKLLGKKRNALLDYYQFEWDKAWDNSFVREVKEFISAIEEERPSAIPLQQGRDVLEICLEIKRQIANDQERWEEAFDTKA